MPQQKIQNLRAIDPDTGCVHAVIEAVRGTRNKFKFDERRALFIHDGVLPAGAVYPFDFGFIPSTKGDDGDPIDILVLMEEPAFVGAVVPCRLVGAIEAEQTEEDGEAVRNDRLLGIAAKSHLYGDVREIADLPTGLVAEVEEFWTSYNKQKGKEFRPIGRADAASAMRLLRPAKGRKR